MKLKGKKISEVSQRFDLTGKELLPFAQDGENGSMSIDTIASYAYDKEGGDFTSRLAYDVQVPGVELIADRAEKDAFGNIITDTYITRSGVNKAMNEAIKEQLSDAIANIDDGFVTPNMLSEETKQLFGAETITNFPDNEDITVNSSNQLTLADKEYNPTTYSGMGRKKLRKNMINGVNILTQNMLNKQNTIYVIQYDFDLNGGEITIPEGCVLDFQGGLFKNGHIRFKSTLLNGDVKFEQVIFDGLLRNEIVHISWFNKSGDSISDTLQSLILSSRRIFIDKGTWFIDKYIKLYSNTSIEGAGVDNTILMFKHESYTTVHHVMFGTLDAYVGNKYGYTDGVTEEYVKECIDNPVAQNVTIKNISFDKGDPSIYSYCIQYIQSDNCKVENCNFSYPKGEGVMLYSGASIMYIYSKHGLVDKCNAHDDVLVSIDMSEYCSVINCCLERAKSTGIETRYGGNHVISNNYVKDNYDNTSVVGINSPNCIVNNNKIYLTTEDGMTANAYSCLTIGHEDIEGNMGDGCVVKNNHLVSYGGTCALLIQSGNSVIVDSNYIKTHESVSYGIYCAGGQYRNIKYSNNIIDSKTVGLYFYALPDYPEADGVIFINNKVDAPLACDIRRTNLFVCRNNILNGTQENDAVYFRSCQFIVIDSNKINNYTLVANKNYTEYYNSVKIINNIIIDTIIEQKLFNDLFVNNNFITFTKPIDAAIKVYKVLEKLNISDNSFSIPSESLISVIYFYKGSVTDDINIYNINVGENYTKGLKEIQVDTTDIANVNGQARAFLLARESTNLKIIQKPSSYSGEIEFANGLPQNTLYLDKVNNTFSYWDKSNKRLRTVNSGYKAILNRGTERPILDKNTDVGFCYYDTLLNKPIWWTGSKWVDATGADV